MTTPNNALKVYLGTNEDGGYQPIGCEDRLRLSYPDNFDTMMTMISPYLNEDHTPDWGKHDLNQVGKAFADELQVKYPELEPLIAKSLGNRFTYSLR